MALYFEIKNGIINLIRDVNDPQPNIDHNGFNNEGVTWLEQSGDYDTGDLYDGTTLSYGAGTLAKAREWRDSELQSTDSIIPLTDHPDHAATITYRQELRDWPSTEQFPNTKPTKP
tara:strand:- start:351 stop:698 length:348 start_codon:yes stop_codon:yes gene_type:complete